MTSGRRFVDTDQLTLNFRFETLLGLELLLTYLSDNCVIHRHLIILQVYIDFCISADQISIMNECTEEPEDMIGQKPVVLVRRDQERQIHFSQTLKILFNSGAVQVGKLLWANFFIYYFVTQLKIATILYYFCFISGIASTCFSGYTFSDIQCLTDWLWNLSGWTTQTKNISFEE